MASVEFPRAKGLLADLKPVVGDRGILVGEDVASRGSEPFQHVPPPLGRDHSAREYRGTHKGHVRLSRGWPDSRNARKQNRYRRRRARRREDESVISLEQMTRILEIDPIGQTMTVEAGASVEAVHDAAAQQGLLHPIDLGSRGSATVGGTIATNAGGNRAIRWGMTPPFAVLPTTLGCACTV